MVSSRALEKILCIVGPTASGKSRLALDLAKTFDGEIINADSRQFYSELGIATDKPSLEDRKLIPHHLVDVASITEPWSVADFVSNGEKAIYDLLARGKVPIVVGGTGMYIKSLLFGLDTMPAIPDDLRTLLQRRLADEGLPKLYQELKKVDPQSCARLEPHDTQRILRALEVFLHTGQCIHTFWQQNKAAKFDYVKLALQSPREILYQKINDRVLGMMQQGLKAEAKDLFTRFPNNTVLAKTIGYAEWKELGFSDEKRVVAEIQKNSRHFAKRQITWFGRETDVRWVADAAAATSFAASALRP